jgi:hypothetical protein
MKYQANAEEDESAAGKLITVLRLAWIYMLIVIFCLP